MISEFREDLLKRYRFSNYIIDPNRDRFTAVIRILALVIRFVYKLKSRVVQRRTDPTMIFQAEDNRLLIIHEAELNAAKKYFFTKATLEVKEFLKPAQLIHIFFM